ncbi:MAG TPA: MFS transporter, partial [Acidimicrobiia bacterium]|nr:MFS transporter [Acidimicrobiia bacterium]
EEPPVPPAFWRVFGTKDYFRLWVAQVVSSLGDWIGILAILAIATKISSDPAGAAALVMMARVVPGFFLATVGGVLVDRWDRRKVMVCCDLGRAALLVLLPFIDNLLGLVLVSFALEILTLLWGPAKDASVPNIVGKEQLASANSLSLFASFGTFPIGALIFTALAGIANLLGHVSAFHSLGVDRGVLALWVDALTYLTSAILVFRLPLGRKATDVKEEGESNGRRVDLTGTFRDLKEGMQFLTTHRLVRGVIVGLGVGIIGGGAMIPLGPVFAREGLGGDNSSTFGLLMVALGTGAAIGVISLMALQKRLPRDKVFYSAVVGTGVSLIAAVSFSSLAPAAFLVAAVGACAGTAYVTGFTLIQEKVEDELRGRTFATLYTVVRMCLLISLTVSPLFAKLYDWIDDLFLTHRTVHLWNLHYAVPGVRLALWAGGLLAIVAGLFARREVKLARRTALHPSSGVVE